MAETFKGSPRNLANMHTIFINKYIEPKFEEFSARGANELDFWNLLIACSFRAWIGQEAFVEYMEDKWHLIKNVVDKLGSLTDEVSTIKDSWEALSYAIKVKRKIYGDDKEPEHDSEPGDDDSEPGDGSDWDETTSSAKRDSDEEDYGDSEEGDSDSDSDEEDEKSKGDSDEEDSKEEGDSDEDSDSEDSDEGDSSGSGDEDSDMGEDDIDDGESDVGENEDSGGAPTDNDEMGEKESPMFDEDSLKDLTEFDSALEDVIESLTNVEHDSSSYVPYSTEGDVIETAKSDHITDTDVKELEHGMSDLIRPMTRSLERVFVAKNKARWETGLRSGKINQFGLSRLFSEDDRVFRKLKETRTKDVAVQLVIDCSGSMWHESNGVKRISLAAQTALAFSEVLSKLKISHEVIGYTTKRVDGSLRRAMDKDGIPYGKYDRLQPLYIPIFKDFKENFGNHIKRRLAAAHSCKMDLMENVDGESILVCANRLMRQREPGKAMIVLSDGSPACSGSPVPTLNKHLKDSVKTVEKAGVDVIAFGIMTSEPKRYYDKFVQIDDLQSLPTKVISQLRGIVTKV